MTQDCFVYRCDVVSNEVCAQDRLFSKIINYFKVHRKSGSVELNL